jgi:peptidyl-prolyl cis-trans isomerase C
MKSLRLTTIVFLLATVAAAYAADPKTTDKADKKNSSDASSLPDPVAEVEGRKINKADLEKDFKAALESSGKPASDLTDQQKQQGYRAVLDDMIIERLLTKRSADLKVTDAEVEKNLEQYKVMFPTADKLNEALKSHGLTLDKMKDDIRNSLRQQQWIEAQVAGKIGVTDADAQTFYNGNTDKFQMPDSVRASHILFAVPQDAKPDVATDKEKLAKSTKARIDKGEDFAKLAKDLSDDPGSKANGGDLDFFTHDRMVPEFADAAFKLKVGEVSDPVKSQFGYHIIKVTDKKAARTVPFAEAKDKILAYLKETKKRQAVNELITSMRAKADVKVYLSPLPQPSEPSAPSMPPAP